jgi:hypothetical protein
MKACHVVLVFAVASIITLSCTVQTEDLGPPPAGAEGPAGPTGAPGDDGQEGPPGASSPWVVGEDGTTIYYEDGYVGIGTETPRAELDVSGLALGAEDSYGEWAGVYRSLDGAAPVPFNDYDHLVLQTRSNAQRGIYFGTSDGAGVATRIAIAASGLVGIGTSSPDALLHVLNGNVHVQGAGRQVILERNSDNAAAHGLGFLKSRGSSDAPAAVQTGRDLILSGK